MPLDGGRRGVFCWQLIDCLFVEIALGVDGCAGSGLGDIWYCALSPPKLSMVRTPTPNANIATIRCSRSVVTTVWIQTLFDSNIAAIFYSIPRARDSACRCASLAS